MAIAYLRNALGGTTTTTSFTITLPETAAGDLIIIEFAHRGTGNGSWAGTYNGPAFVQKHKQLFATSLYSGQSWWAIASQNHSGQTVIVSVLTNSCAAICTVYSGADTTDPLGDAVIVGEQNALGNETQAQITTNTAGAYVVLLVVNSPDYAIATQACTSPGVLTERAERLSTGGTDTSVAHASAAKAAAGATGAFTWTQTDAVSGSWAYAIKPGAEAIQLTNVGNISSVETHGVHLLSVALLTIGIASGTIFGTATVAPYSEPIELTDTGGIGSSEAHGNHGLSVVASPAGIVSSETFGLDIINLVVDQAGTISSQETIGTASVSTDLSGAGAIITSEIFGVPAIGGSPAEITDAGNIGSIEAHGIPALFLEVAPTGIVSIETVGIPHVLISLVPVGISSSEQIGLPAVQIESEDVDLTTVGNIVSAEAFGIPQIGYHLVGITREASGGPIGLCLVRLFQSENGAFVQEMVSASDGSFSMIVPNNTTKYFLVAYKKGNPNRAGTTINDLVGS